MRSVPVRIYLPDGPVVQELAPPLMDDGAPSLFNTAFTNSFFLSPSPGSPHTLAHFFSTHLGLLFPPRPPPPPPSRLNPNPQAPPAQELAFALIQGVIAPPEAELAWLGACLAGADGWLNICVGISRG
jgi:autophagy-related protein 5